MTSILDCPPSGRKLSAVVDLAEVKARQQVMWASGDAAILGTTIQIVGECLCEAVDLEAGARVLDVACGNGNAALAAARRWAQVTGLDSVPAMLGRAADRARAEGLALELVLGDAEHLPFDDARFDVALSTFGVMFAPDQEQAARELVRVVRPGGTIGLASWTPEGFVGRFLRIVCKHVPPPPGVASPIYWGTEARVAELFGDVRAIRAVRRELVLRYRSAAHLLDVLRQSGGPTHAAFAALDAAGQARLTADLEVLATTSSRRAGSLVVPAEYLEAVIER